MPCQGFESRPRVYTVNNELCVRNQKWQTISVQISDIIKHWFKHCADPFEKLATQYYPIMLHRYPSFIDYLPSFANMDIFIEPYL